MIRLEIRHGGAIRVCTVEGKTAIVVVASYRSVLRNPIHFKVLQGVFFSGETVASAGKLTIAIVLFIILQLVTRPPKESTSVWL